MQVDIRKEARLAAFATLPDGFGESLRHTGSHASSKIGCRETEIRRGGDGLTQTRPTPLKESANLRDGGKQADVNQSDEQN